MASENSHQPVRSTAAILRSTLDRGAGQAIEQSPCAAQFRRETRPAGGSSGSAINPSKNWELGRVRYTSAYKKNNGAYLVN